MRNFKFITLSALALTLLAGCNISAISPNIREQDLPANWQSVSEYAAIDEDWLLKFEDAELLALQEKAAGRSYSLAAAAAVLEEARQGVIISGADRYPQLDLSFDASRRRSLLNDSAAGSSSNFELGLDLSWELDIWGKLNDAQKQASLNLAAAQARYRDIRQQLAADVAAAWFKVISAQQLLTLFEERLANLETDTEIIERAYSQGLNTALDVYLARSNLDQERAGIARQQQLLSENRIALQLLLADYPDASLRIDKPLPELTDNIASGLPAELVNRRADIQQAWMELLASDAGLAIAHKQRFPRISLSASGSDVSSDLSELLNGSALAWSLLGNLTQPLFNAGRLRALQEQARTRVVQAENQYLTTLYQALSEVENAISRQASLRTRYEATVAAEKNAVAGLSLAKEQYQKGLITYTTVLESQRRAFDAQSGVIELRNELLQNRIRLYRALGGNTGV